MISLLCLAALPWLGGCNSIYSNYREIENLLVVRSVGFDREDGGTRFSLASSANDDGEPIRMTTKGGSITDAMERIRNYSSQEDIFYPHVEHILLGEDAARVSIEDYLAFFCRSPELRIDIPLYIVRGGTAEQAVLETGSDSRCISEILQTEQERLSELVPRAIGELRHAILTTRIRAVKRRISAAASAGDASAMRLAMQELIELNTLKSEFATYLGDRIVTPPHKS